MSAVSPEENLSSIRHVSNDKVLLAMKCQVRMMGFEYIIHMGIYGLKVCGKVSSIDTLWAACVQHRPDVLIMNLDVSKGSDRSLIRQLRHKYPNLRIIVMARTEGGFSLQDAIKSGALAYISEGDSIESVLKAVIDAQKGHLHIGSFVASQVFQSIASGNAEIVMKPQSLLTPRELEVFRQRGFSNSIKEIATKLNLSPKTVEGHLMQIRQKLKLKSTDDLRRIAVNFLTEEHLIIGENESVPFSDE